MDGIALAFYATVCGLLAAVGPSLGGMVTRIIAGVGVGLVAASLLPFIKAAIAAG